MMLYRDALIINKLGLHARASAKLTQLASSFKCEVMLSRNDRRVNAKSIMGVMMLAAAKGTTIGIETDGTDEEKAMQALLNLINDYFGEGE
jgi:phosphocarrier protein HPr